MHRYKFICARLRDYNYTILLYSLARKKKKVNTFALQTQYFTLASQNRFGLFHVAAYFSAFFIKL